MTGALIQRIRRLFYDRSGPLTAELKLSDGGPAVGRWPGHMLPDATTDLVCGFCATGCSLTAHIRGDNAVTLSPNTQHPVNLGMACPKGWEALSALDAGNRATQPLIRRQGRLEPVEWDEAAEEMLTRMRAVQAEHGPDSCAFLSTGQIPLEEMAFLGLLARGPLGIRHGDGNTRQCMATAVAAYKQSFGFDAPPYTYADFEVSDCIILVGSNLSIAHPIMWERIKLNRNNPDIVVIDPRFTETAQGATHHLQIQPKSDLTLLYGVARQIIEIGGVDTEFVRNHTRDFEAFSEFVRPFDLAHTSAVTGLTAREIQTLAAQICNAKAASLWWTMGVNQSHEGVLVAQAIINIALMTGNIGRPGTGANSITGQCNAMGSRLFSNTTCLAGGHPFADPSARALVSQTTGLPEHLLPESAGWAYDQIIRGVLDGQIKALWVIATNSAHSWIQKSGLSEALEALDLLVVQDMYADTQTAELADIVLPAAAWGEKEGVFINSERRLGVIRAVRRAPGAALTDFRIFKLIAEQSGNADLFSRWTDPESAFRMLAETTRGNVCDISGITSYEQISETGGIQWPYRGEQDNGAERRLFSDGCFPTADGRARFVFGSPRAPKAQKSRSWPLTLTTGRGTAVQWHTQTRTSRSAVLKKLYPESVYIEINALDAAIRGINDGSEVAVQSPDATVRATAHVVSTLRPGTVFMPMHYDETNMLTFAEFDPSSRQPSYKYAVVEVRPVGTTLS